MLNKYGRILAIVLIAQAVLFYTASHGDATPLNAPLSAFPSSFGDWRLKFEGIVDQEELDVLKADDTLTRNYSNPSGAEANLFIAYFKTQRTGQSPHSPKNCLPGSGWQSDPARSGIIEVPVGNETISINHYSVSKGENESIVLYWYQSHGRTIAGEFSAKFHLIADSIRLHRSDSALVRLVIPVPPGRREEADALALDFAKSAYPAVRNFLPR